MENNMKKVNKRWCMVLFIIFILGVFSVNSYAQNYQIYAREYNVTIYNIQQEEIRSIEVLHRITRMTSEDEDKIEGEWIREDLFEIRYPSSSYDYFAKYDQISELEWSDNKVNFSIFTHKKYEEYDVYSQCFTIRITKVDGTVSYSEILYRDITVNEYSSKSDDRRAYERMSNATAYFEIEYSNESILEVANYKKHETKEGYIVLYDTGSELVMQEFDGENVSPSEYYGKGMFYGGNKLEYCLGEYWYWYVVMATIAIIVIIVLLIFIIFRIKKKKQILHNVKEDDRQ